MVHPIPRRRLGCAPTDRAIARRCMRCGCRLRRWLCGPPRRLLLVAVLLLVWGFNRSRRIWLLEQPGGSSRPMLWRFAERLLLGCPGAAESGARRD